MRARFSRVLSRVFWTASGPRATAETVVLYALLTLGLWSMHQELNQAAMIQGLLFVSLGAGAYGALRLRVTRAGGWRREIPVAVYLIVLFTAVNILLTQVLMPVELALPLIVQFLFAAFPGSTYPMARIGINLLRFWDWLRRHRLLWSLTHAHLLVVVLIGAAFMIALTMLSLFRSSEYYRAVAAQLSDMSLSAVTKAVIGLVLIFSSLAFVTLIALLVVIPPSAVFSFLVMRGTVRRLRNLAVATQAVRAKNYAARVKVQGEDEVARVQADFNAMAADLEQAIKDLQTERDTVQQLLQMRRDLTANVSHDLRTPITSLRASLEAAIDHETPPSLHQVQVMHEDVLHLQRMVDDLFTLSRVDVGQLTIRCQPDDVGPIVQRVVESMAAYAWRAHRIEITAAIPDTLPRVNVDAERLDQVLRNLLHNGLRHTPSGGIITVEVTAEPDAVTIEVWDSGEGISPEDLLHVWERFYKVSALSSDNHRLGLGLAIVKELTEAMHGTVGVDSTPGAGSRFVVRLPISPMTQL